jgi:hypothetical protein
VKQNEVATFACKLSLCAHLVQMSCVLRQTDSLFPGHTAIPCPDNQWVCTGDKLP